MGEPSRATSRQFAGTWRSCAVLPAPLPRWTHRHFGHGPRFPRPGQLDAERIAYLVSQRAGAGSFRHRDPVSCRVQRSQSPSAGSSEPSSVCRPGLTGKAPTLPVRWRSESLASQPEGPSPDSPRPVYVPRTPLHGFHAEQTSTITAASLSVPVEADEAYIGGKRKNMPKSRREAMRNLSTTLRQ